MIDERPARVVCHRPGPLNETGGAQGTAERIGSNELAAEGANQRRGSCRQPRRVLRKKKKIVSIFSFFFLFCPKRWTKRKQVVIPISSSSFHIYLYEKKKNKRESAGDSHGRMMEWQPIPTASLSGLSRLLIFIRTANERRRQHRQLAAQGGHTSGCCAHIFIFVCVCIYLLYGRVLLHH